MDEFIPGDEPRRGTVSIVIPIPPGIGGILFHLEQELFLFEMEVFHILFYLIKIKLYILNLENKILNLQ